MMSKKRWTNAELLTLGDLYRDGLSYNEIACKMNRSKQSVAHALHSYRNVINVDYRRKRGEYHTAVPEVTQDQTPKEPVGFIRKIWDRVTGNLFTVH